MESALRVVYFMYAELVLVLTMASVMGCPKYLSDTQILTLVIVSIPTSALFCLCRPMQEDAMKYFIVPPKYLNGKPYLESTGLMLKVNALLVVLCSTSLAGLHFLQMARSSQDLELTQAANLMATVLVMQLTCLYLESPKYPIEIASPFF